MTTHKCDEWCVCPVHGAPMLYAPACDRHACPHADCEYAHEASLGLELAMRFARAVDTELTKTYRMREPIIGILGSPAATRRDRPEKGSP